MNTGQIAYVMTSNGNEGTLYLNVLTYRQISQGYLMQIKRK